MDPISTLQTQVAALQVDVAWLTRLVWAMITVNGASFLLNGFLGALMVRNNKSSKK